MADLRTRYLGLELRSPLVASSSPLTGSLDGLRRLEAAGAGAVVLPSLFEEELAPEGQEGPGDGPASDAPDAPGDQAGYGAGPAAYLSLVERAKQVLSVPVIASLNGVSRTGWVRYAARLEQAGADALELNVYYVSSRPGLSGSEVEWHYLDVVRAVRRAIGIPLAVKLSRISARWPTWRASWSRPVPTGWCCSTASTSPTWTSRRWRWHRGWS
jgi:dihydroorotate dehydrogenase (fumarate)